MVMAGSLVSALPAIVVYLIFQRYLISGLTMGMSRQPRSSLHRGTLARRRATRCPVVPGAPD